MKCIKFFQYYNNLLFWNLSQPALGFINCCKTKTRHLPSNILTNYFLLMNMADQQHSDDNPVSTRVQTSQTPAAASYENQFSHCCPSDESHLLSLSPSSWFAEILSTKSSINSSLIESTCWLLKMGFEHFQW